MAEATTATETATGGTAAAADSAAATAAASLLGGADAGKRDGAAPAADAGAKTEDKSGDKPATGEAPAAGDPPAVGKEPTKTDSAESGKAPAGDAETAKAGSEGKTPEPPKPDAAGTDTAGDKKDAAAETQPPAPPVYEALTLPEGVQLDTQAVGKLDAILGKTELATKGEHGAFASLRQEIADLYLAEVQRIGTEVQQYQRDVWNRLNETRITELKSDPELGGNRIETTLGNAKYALESMMGLSKDEASKLIEVMDAGGVSNHRLLIKALNGVYERYREPEPVNPNLPSNPSQPGQRNWYQKVDGAAAA